MNTIPYVLVIVTTLLRKWRTSLKLKTSPVGWRWKLRKKNKKTRGERARESRKNRWKGGRGGGGSRFRGSSLSRRGKTAIQAQEAGEKRIEECKWGSICKGRNIYVASVEYRVKAEAGLYFLSFPFFTFLPSKSNGREIRREGGRERNKVRRRSLESSVTMAMHRCIDTQCSAVDAGNRCRRRGAARIPPHREFYL